MAVPSPVAGPASLTAISHSASMKYMMFARVFMFVRSSCSRIHECRSSSISRFLSAYTAAFWIEVCDALRCDSSVVKRWRTSKGSAIVRAARMCRKQYVWCSLGKLGSGVWMWRAECMRQWCGIAR